ncbi:MAG: CoA-disulfide reductase [Candidatus Sumerlaea sp.]|jgi:NADPH-dependent 2,4-dienoyl-CoA reductase/sulfur reductase-like enzyme/rhodanese-related sulfurtransferase|uniref:CoA-disulfide reductase n=1 Tax=Sumerlaea chitinivorans TaxID=2250252 RepID=A0A2Z4Y4V8_SUMC1|nr:CoA-disulfide reductase [Candidatus Sumerlaea chitinivorans]GIX44124.1 MAG: CoA-disulfide reductase [Candidatus Sumerlaea sp.]
MRKKILIIGGVAAGMSCAVRARRLSEDAEIIVVERGPYVSFANCGLPYYIGGEITDREKLLVQTPEQLRARFNLDVRVNTEAVRIDPKAKVVELVDRTNEKSYAESYDELVLAVGAVPLKPPIPGIERMGHFVVRNIPDVDAITNWLQAKSVKRAVVVGGGYIGLEVTEQLHRRGIEVAIAEALPQVMAPLDPEMAELLHAELRRHNVDLHLNDGVVAFEEPAPGEDARASTVVLQSGTRLPADIVILGIGVRPDTTLAQTAGVQIGPRKGIVVDEYLRTSVPNIWAAGDAVEVPDFVTGESVVVPLAGPANRQGRMIADNIFGRNVRYRGTLGTAILRVFSLVAACTGANEKTLRRLRRRYEVIHLHPASHASYYPGAKPLSMKVIFDPENGRVLGAQIVGQETVDRRIDVLATAIRAGLTVDDLADLELAYAPPFGSAKDPVNIAGMIGQNVRNGLVSHAQWYELTEDSSAVILDVRTPGERKQGAIPNSIHIPLDELRQRLHELPKDRNVIVYCAAGQRSYYASRLLTQHGFRVRNLTGAFRTWKTATGGAA